MQFCNMAKINEYINTICIFLRLIYEAMLVDRIKFIAK